MNTFDLTNFVPQVVAYLLPMCSEDKLRDLYNFPIRKPLDHFAIPAPLWLDELKVSAKNSEDNYSLTLKLREKMQVELQSSDLGRTAKIAEWIVKDWGGIPLGNDLPACVKRAEEEHVRNVGEFTFERIASWSKFLAFKYPQKYAIYDARVVYSLNWILLVSGAKKFLPVLEGRNSVMGLLDYKLRLLIDVHGKSRIEVALAERKGNKTHFMSGLEKDVFFEKTKAFSIYCYLLSLVAAQIYPNDSHGLTKVEMILFSIADRGIAQDVLRQTL